MYENTHAFTVLMQGTITANLVYGAGVRCIGGMRRLYTGNAGGIPPCQQAEGFYRPSPADPRSVSRASLDAGYNIAAHAPITLYYQAFYRDAHAAAYCGGATVNASEAAPVDWIP
jgi:PAB1-binding protein PBP1